MWHYLNWMQFIYSQLYCIPFPIQGPPILSFCLLKKYDMSYNYISNAWAQPIHANRHWPFVGKLHSWSFKFCKFFAHRANNGWVQIGPWSESICNTKTFVIAIPNVSRVASYELWFYFILFFQITEPSKVRLFCISIHIK